MAKITFNLTDEECQLIDEEAASHDMPRATYVATIVGQRKAKAITVQSDDPKLIGRMEGTIEAQAAQIIDLTERLSRSAEQAGMAGVETGQKLTKSAMQDAINQAKKEWQYEMDQKELLELRQFKEKAEKQIDDLTEHKNSNDKFDKGLNGVKEIVMNTPGLLTGLLSKVGFSLEGAPAPGLGATPEDEHALNIGRAVTQEIAAEIQPELMIILNHLSQVPADINAIIKTKPFADARRKALAQQNPAS